MKDREERRRLRTVAWLSNSLEGATREPDTEYVAFSLCLSERCAHHSVSRTGPMRRRMERLYVFLRRR